MTEEKYRSLKNRFPEVLKRFRLSRNVNQVELTKLMSFHEGINYDTSVISKWESGTRRPPPKSVLEAIADSLKLTMREKNELIEAARYEILLQAELAPEEPALPASEAIQNLDERVANLTSQVNTLTTMLVRIFNPISGPILSNNRQGILGNSLQKGVFPCLYLGVVGTVFKTLDIHSSALLITFAAIALGLVVVLGLIRIHKVTSAYYDGLPLAAKRGLTFGELLFISLFVMLNVQLLLAANTGMDLYGFYGISSLTGTVLPLLFTALVNLAASVIVTALFHILWHRQCVKESKKGKVYNRAVKIMLPPLLALYVPLALLSVLGGDIFYLIVMALLFCAFVVMIAFSDPEVKLPQWTAKFSLSTAVAIMIVLFVAAIAGLLVLYTGNHPIEPRNHIWSWAINWSALPYGPADYIQHQKDGLLWMVLAGIAYMEIVVGGYLLVTIYRHQVALKTETTEDKAGN